MTFDLGPYRFGFQHDLIEHDHSPYLERWILWFGFSLRIHRFLASDRDRAMHDHPWWFVTLPLAGYMEFTPDNIDGRLIKPWRLHLRGAHAIHRVMLLRFPTWTIVLTGVKSRQWGFWDEGTFAHHEEWLKGSLNAGNNGRNLQ